jgi:TrmH family RNA methyltransferase
LRKTTSDRVRIESADNEVVRRLRRLGVRREPGVVLLEGPRVVREAVACGVRLEVLATGESADFSAPAERTVILGERALGAASHTVTPQGVLAIARADFVPAEEAVEVSRAAGWPLPVLDGIQDPGNVGTICRSAAAAGAPALMVLDGTADPFGAKAVRASAGTVFRLKLARGRWDDVAVLSGYAASASGGVRLEDAALEGGDVLALGGETRGVRRRDLTPVTIPMWPGVESLNVAAAAAILLFELRRRLDRRQSRAVQGAEDQT